MAIGDKYQNLINEQLDAVKDSRKGQAWTNKNRAGIVAAISGQGDLAPKKLQGQGVLMDTSKLNSVKVSPEALAQRQKLLAGNRDAMSRQFVSQNQLQSDAIKRRFAQLGNAGGGASLKAQLEAQGQLGNAQASQERELAGQELQAQQAFEEAQAGRDQSAQALKAQYDAQNVQSVNQREMYNAELENKFAEYNQQAELQRAQQLYDIDTTEFNRGIAQLAAGGGK